MMAKGLLGWHFVRRKCSVLQKLMSEVEISRSD